MELDTISYYTRNQVRQVFEALRELTALPEAVPQHHIAFVHPKDSRGKSGEL